MSNTSLKVRYVWWYRTRIISITILVLLIAVCLFFINALSKYDGHHTAKLTDWEAATTMKWSIYFFASLLVLFTLWLFRAILNWVRKRKYYWEIRPDGISINSGYIYEDSFHNIPSRKIIGAAYYRGTLGKLLNFGYVDINHFGLIDISEGRLKLNRGGPFSNAIAIADAINAIAGAQSIGEQVADAVSQKENHQISKADELEKLIELKSQGKISDEEYNELKSKLFG